MSYILEALKKLEQKQQREGAPRLLTLPLDVPEAEKKSRVLPYVIVGALLLNAVVMLAWRLIPKYRPEPVIPASQTTSIQHSPHAKMETASTAVVQTPAMVKSPVKQAVPTTEKPPAASNSRAFEDTGKAPGPGLPASVEPVKPPFEDQSQKKTKSLSPKAAARLLDLGELPPAVRSTLPQFKISGHAYSSEPRFRVARINNKIIQEGEALTQGLKVDEIVPGGVIFTYQGYRFRVGTNDGP